MLLGMTVDERLHLKELATGEYWKLEINFQKEKSVRTFLPLLLNFEALDYIELIDWTKCKLSSRPVLESVPTGSTLLFLESKDFS